MIEKSKLLFSGYVDQHGQFVPDNPAAWKNHKQFFKKKPVYVQMGDWNKYKKRSTAQNNYLHGVVCEILSDENGDTKDYWYKYIKIKYVLPMVTGQKEVDVDSIIESGKFDEIADMLTTTNLNTKQFSYIMHEARKWAKEQFNVTIHPPETVPFEY